MTIFKSFLFFTGFVVVMAGHAFGQQEAFTVMGLHGEIFCAQADAPAWVRVKVGQQLGKGATVKLTGDVYLGLMHSTGKTMELKKAGVYEVSMLMWKCRSKESIPLSHKLLKFVVAEMNDETNATTGGVTAAVERAVTMKGSIDAALPYFTRLMDSVVHFAWFATEGTASYQFRITDRYARDVFTADLRDTTVAVDLDRIGTKRDENYYWSVTMNDDKGTRSNECVFIRLTDKAKEQVEDTVARIAAEVGDNSSASTNIVLAAYYTDQELLERAMNAYEAALRQAPEVDEYKQLYASFLMKIGLSEKARQLWKRK